MSSNNCKNCGRTKDLNNNYTSLGQVSVAGQTTNNSPSSRNMSASGNSNSNSTSTNTSNINSNSNSNSNNKSSGTPFANKKMDNKECDNGGIADKNTSCYRPHNIGTVNAKIMWGSVLAIKELREQEQAERNNAAKTGRRQ